MAAAELEPVAAEPEPDVETGPGPTVEPVAPAASVPGRIAVTSNPVGAKMYLRQSGQESFQYLGTTPLTTDDLAPGLWEIRVEQDGHEGSSAVVRLRPGEVRRLPVTLARTMNFCWGDRVFSWLISTMDSMMLG